MAGHLKGLTSWRSCNFSLRARLPPNPALDTDAAKKRRAGELLSLGGRWPTTNLGSRPCDLQEVAMAYCHSCHESRPLLLGRSSEEKGGHSKFCRNSPRNTYGRAPC